jgi:hypothetical protein
MLNPLSSQGETVRFFVAWRPSRGARRKKKSTATPIHSL